MSETINPKPKVFMAYSSNDRDDAIKLASRLREAGIDVWQGQETVGQGYFETKEIEAVLSQCTACLVLVSMHADKDFAESGPIGGGIGRGPIGGSPLGGFIYGGIIGAIERRVRKDRFHVIPVLLSGVEKEALRHLPVFMRPLDWVKLADSLDVDRLLVAIRANFPEASTVSSPVREELNAVEKGTDTAQVRVSLHRPNKKIIRLPDIDWVEIPAGPFIYGKKDQQRTLELARFYISRYPITHSQYQTFIDAGGYDDERWWQDLKKPAPAEPRWKQPNRPRERVDWYEAVAFTRWLSAQLGHAVTLPTEEQWEKAARGADGQVYPWGSEYKTGDANVHDASAGDDNLEQTCAVGLYPHCASPYGVLDVAGNVWEWCLNQYNQPEHIDADTSGVTRVLRGGSWDGRPGRARCVVRVGFYPDFRLNSFGFRVVCSSLYTER